MNLILCRYLANSRVRLDMGKKAKIKKIRKESSKISEINNQYKSTQFVKQLTQLGYDLGQTKRSPEVPKDKTEPQL